MPSQPSLIITFESCWRRFTISSPPPFLFISVCLLWELTCSPSHLFFVLFSLTILSSSGGLCSFHFHHCLLVVMHPPFLHLCLLNSLLLRFSHTSASVLICFILFAPLFAPSPDCLDFFLLVYLTPSFFACPIASSPPACVNLLLFGLRNDPIWFKTRTSFHINSIYDMQMWVKMFTVYLTHMRNEMQELV